MRHQLTKLQVKCLKLAVWVLKGIHLTQLMWRTRDLFWMSVRLDVGRIIRR